MSSRARTTEYRDRTAGDGPEEATRQTLTRAGISTGQRCLDVGCGTGSVMRIMGEMVGPVGLVLGLDVDERIGNTAPTYSTTPRPAQVRTR